MSRNGSSEVKYNHVGIYRIFVISAWTPGNMFLVFSQGLVDPCQEGLQLFCGQSEPLHYYEDGHNILVICCTYSLSYVSYHHWNRNFYCVVCTYAVKFLHLVAVFLGKLLKIYFYSFFNICLKHIYNGGYFSEKKKLSKCNLYYFRWSF